MLEFYQEEWKNIQKLKQQCFLLTSETEAGFQMVKLEPSPEICKQTNTGSTTSGCCRM